MEHRTGQPERRIVALNRDLFFGVRLKQLGVALGYRVDLVADTAGFVQAMHEADVTLGIIDINAAPNWNLIADDALSSARPPILAFGPHMDVDGLRAAKQAGVTRVVSNGQFHRDAAELIHRYAGTVASQPNSESTDIPG